MNLSQKKCFLLRSIIIVIFAHYFGLDPVSHVNRRGFDGQMVVASPRIGGNICRTPHIFRDSLQEFELCNITHQSDCVFSQASIADVKGFGKCPILGDSFDHLNKYLDILYHVYIYHIYIYHIYIYILYTHIILHPQYLGVLFGPENHPMGPRSRQIRSF